MRIDWNWPLCMRLGMKMNVTWPTDWIFSFYFITDWIYFVRIYFVRRIRLSLYRWTNRHLTWRRYSHTRKVFLKLCSHAVQQLLEIIPSRCKLLIDWDWLRPRNCHSHCCGEIHLVILCYLCTCPPPGGMPKNILVQNINQSSSLITTTFFIIGGPRSVPKFDSLRFQ